MKQEAHASQRDGAMTRRRSRLHQHGCGLSTLAQRTFWYVSGGGEKSGGAMTGMGIRELVLWGCAPLPLLCCDPVPGMINGDAVAHGRRFSLPAAHTYVKRVPSAGQLSGCSLCLAKL